MRETILTSIFTARGWIARAVLCLLVTLGSCDRHAGSGKVGETPHKEAVKEAAAESWMVVCFEYLGPSDRPPLPVIFARDAANLQAFLAAHQDAPRYQHGRQLLVQAAALECLVKAVERHPTPQTQPGQSQELALRATLWESGSEEHFDLSASEGMKLFEAMDACPLSTEAVSAIKTIKQWLIPTATSP